MMRNIAKILKAEGDKLLPRETNRTSVFARTSGHHRSVGWSVLVCGISEEVGFEAPRLKFFPNNPARLCQECAPWAAETPHWKEHRSQIHQEAATMIVRMNEDLGFWG